ncbi:MAG: DUF4249 domain-containing protein [Bacteroidetes bacterium]|nr:DUF4249 domain-containing protein [Bacteroidota bacterium]
MKRLTILAMIAALITTACRKDIHLNLQNASGLLVIEGNISDQSGPYLVQLSKTVTFYDVDTVVPVSGATVTIADDAGGYDSLRELTPGSYYTTTLSGAVGRTYHMHVHTEGKDYDASSTMQPPVAIDSIGINGSIFSGNPRGFIQFTDPAGIVNYYRTILYLHQYIDSTTTDFHHTRQHKIAVVNDRLNDGLIIQSTVRADYDIEKGDTLQVELDAIEKPVYDYWYTINNSTTSSQTAAPANPPSNISNGALGYFCAYSATYSKHVVYDGNIRFHRID